MRCGRGKQTIRQAVYDVVEGNRLFTDFAFNMIIAQYRLAIFENMLQNRKKIFNDLSRETDYSQTLHSI